MPSLQNIRTLYRFFKSLIYITKKNYIKTVNGIRTWDLDRSVFNNSEQDKL